METTQEFACRLLKITTEQFAIFEDNFVSFTNTNQEKKLSMNVQTRFAASIDDKIVAVFFQFELRDIKTPILIVEAGLHFMLDDATWKTCFNEQNSIIKIPKSFAVHLLGICISTARGIVHSKTEGTVHNGLLIPLLNGGNFIKEDIDIKLDPNKRIEIVKGKVKNVKPEKIVSNTRK